MRWAVVAAGGAIGSLLRYALIRCAPSALHLPVATLVANLAGCFAIGALYVVLAQRGSNSELARLFLMTGVLGGFTTYSAFALDTTLLWTNGAPGRAVIYAGVTVTGCLVAATAGRILAESLQ